MIQKYEKMLICTMFVFSLIVSRPLVSSAKSVTNPYTGSKYVYSTDYKNGILLYGKDGRKKKKYQLIKNKDKEYSMGTIYKTKSFVYYCDTNQGYSPNGNVWQVPVDKKTGKLKTKSKKRLFHVDAWQEFLYATDKKIVYRLDQSIVSYNKKTKKKSNLTKHSDGNGQIQVAKDASGQAAKIGNYIYYTRDINTEAALYQLNIATGKTKKILEGARTDWSKRYRHDYGNSDPVVGISGKKLYVTTKEGIVCYDTANKKKTTLITMESLEQGIKSNNSTDAFESLDVVNYYFLGKTMYLEISLNSAEREGSYGQLVYDKNYIVVSMDKTTGSAFTYENEISAFLKNNGSGYQDSDYDGLKCWDVHTGIMLGMTQKGTWIGEFVDAQGKYFYLTYNAKTKTKKTYSAKKAKVRLLQKGINDQYLPIIC